jgi:hypothetical protein
VRAYRALFGSFWCRYWLIDLYSSSCRSVVVLVVFVLFSPSPPHLPPSVGLNQILCAAVSVFPALGACCFSLFLERPIGLWAIYPFASFSMLWDCTVWE